MGFGRVGGVDRKHGFGQMGEGEDLVKGGGGGYGERGVKWGDFLRLSGNSEDDWISVCLMVVMKA